MPKIFSKLNKIIIILYKKMGNQMNIKNKILKYLVKIWNQIKSNNSNKI